MIRKEKRCKENGYHTWCSQREGITFDSTSENFHEISGTLKCQECGAVAELYGSWEVEDEE